MSVSTRIDRAAALLGIGKDASAESLADVAWLAAVLEEDEPKAGEQGQGNALHGDDLPKEDGGHSLANGNAESSDKEDDEGEVSPRRNGRRGSGAEKRLKVFSNVSAPSGDAIPATVISIPATDPLPARLSIERAFKPFLKKFPSPTMRELDLSATVEASAELRAISPVFRSVQERWFDVVLLVEKSEVMLLWSESVRELHALLERHGAFRAVRTLYYEVSNGAVQLTNVSGQNVNAKSVIDPDGRRLCLFLTNGVSADWGASPLQNFVRSLGKQTVVAIVQMLPQRLWGQTQLGGASEVVYGANRAVPNAALKRVDMLFQQDETARDAASVPLTTLQPGSLTHWARFVMEPRRIQQPAVSLRSLGGSMVAPSGAAMEPGERLTRFRASASPQAFQLLRALAYVPLTLPVMKLVRQSLNLESDESHLAEILLSGLLERVTPRKVVASRDQVFYDFVPGVRELLIQTLSTKEMEELEAVMQPARERLRQYVERAMNTALPDFLALIADPNGLARLPAEAQPFLEISRKIYEMRGVLSSDVETVDELSEGTTQIPELLSTPLIDGSSVGRIILCRNGQYAAALQNSKVTFWDTESGGSRGELVTKRGQLIHMLALSEADTIAVTVQSDGTRKQAAQISLFTVEGRLEPSALLTGTERFVPFVIPNAEVIGLSEQGRIALEHPVLVHVAMTLENPGAMPRLAVAARNLLLEEKENGMLRVSRVEWAAGLGGSAPEVRATRWITHGHPLRDMSISEDGSIAVVVNTSGVVYIIYPLKLRLSQRIPVKDGTCVSVTRDGCFAALGSHHGIVTLWDLTQLKQIAECKDAAGPIKSVSLSAAGDRLVSATNQGAKSWDTRNLISGARMTATPEGLRASIDAGIGPVPSQFVYVTGAVALSQKDGAHQPVDPVAWAADAIGRELARNGMGLITTVNRRVQALENHIALRAFLDETKKLGRDAGSSLVLRVYRDEPSFLRGSLHVEIVNAELRQSFLNSEAVVVLGHDDEATPMLINVDGNRDTDDFVHRVPATAAYVEKVFGTDDSERSIWEEVISTEEDAKRMAAALCSRIVSSRLESLNSQEELRRSSRQKLLGVREALIRKDAAEALHRIQSLNTTDIDHEMLHEVFTEAISQYGERYGDIRRTMRSGSERTQEMDGMVALVWQTALTLQLSPKIAFEWLNQTKPGARVMGIAIAQAHPSLEHLDRAIEMIDRALSPFEQYHAMLLATDLLSVARPEQLGQLERALLNPQTITISPDDPSRYRQRQKMMELLDRLLAGAPDYVLQRVEPPEKAVIFRDNPAQKHGRFVTTRGQHSMMLMQPFEIGKYTVTNRLFYRFVRSSKFYTARRIEPRASSGSSPSRWALGERYPSGTGEHPVSGITYLEAKGFVDWLNDNSKDGSWLWVLPTEDMWEYAARSTRGMSYPWGDVFLEGMCNSVESGIRETSEVGRYSVGASWCGCEDLAGNVWEFVQKDSSSIGCVLRGGSYKNNRDEIKNCFRLQQVSESFPAEDFGFRCARVPNFGGKGKL